VYIYDIRDVAKNNVVSVKEVQRLAQLGNNGDLAAIEQLADMYFT